MLGQAQAQGHCCDSWGSSRRQTGESWRLSLFILAKRHLRLCLVQYGQSCALPARCGSAQDALPVCACPQVSASLSLALASKCVLSCWPAPAAQAWTRLAALQSSNQPTINSTDTHVTCRCYQMRRRIYARLPTAGIILSTVGEANVPQTCLLKPPETSPQPALRSPLRIIIITTTIIERSPRSAVRTCVENRPKM